MPVFSFGQSAQDLIGYSNDASSDSSTYFYAVSDYVMDTFAIYDCPPPKVIAWDYINDGITITESYWEREWNKFGFEITYKCVEKVRKIIFKGEWVQTIEGVVEPEKIVPKQYKFK